MERRRGRTGRVGAAALLVAAATAAPGLAASEPARIMPVFEAPSRSSSSDDDGRSGRSSSSGDFESHAPRFETTSSEPSSTRSTHEWPDEPLTPAYERVRPAPSRREIPAGAADLPRGLHRRSPPEEDHDGSIDGHDPADHPPPPTVHRRRGRHASGGEALLDEGQVAVAPGCDVSVCAAGVGVRAGRVSLGFRAGAMASSVLGGAGVGGGLAVGYHLVPSLALEVRGDAYFSLDEVLSPEAFSMGWLSVGLVYSFNAGSLAQVFMTAGVDAALVERDSVRDLEVFFGGHLGVGVVLVLADQLDLLLEVRGVVTLRDDDIAEAGALITAGVDWYL